MPAVGGPRTVKREAGTSAKGVPVTTAARVTITKPPGSAELEQRTRATWAAGDYPQVARRGSLAVDLRKNDPHVIRRAIR
jgi:hypothetical protein